jgi:hypothetical protein
MPKFILSEIKNRIKAQADSAVYQLKKAKFMTDIAFFSTPEMKYKVMFWGIEGTATGNPNPNQRKAFALVESTIDKRYNNSARKRCKEIANKKMPSEDDIKFLKEELLPYYENSLKLQLDKTKSELGEITEEEMQKAFAIYQSNKKETQKMKGGFK